MPAESTSSKMPEGRQKRPGKPSAARRRWSIALAVLAASALVWTLYNMSRPSGRTAADAALDRVMSQVSAALADERYREVTATVNANRTEILVIGTVASKQAIDDLKARIDAIPDKPAVTYQLNTAASPAGPAPTAGSG